MFQLEIIEEGLQLKLELRSIKEQFAGLLDNFNTFDQTGRLPPQVMEGATKPISATRARVRAVYEARKARLHAKRASRDNESPRRMWKKAKREQREQSVQDKENRHGGTSNYIVTSTPFHKQPTSKTVLTPIKEEHWHTFTTSAKPHRVNRRHSCALTPHVTPICHHQTPSSRYITLKSSLVAKGDYAALSPNIPCAPNQSMVSEYKCNDTSIWSDDSRQSDVTMDVSVAKTGSPVKRCQEGDSPVQYASSNEISALYTSRSLKDISQISQISRSSLREHRSSSNMSGAFHSTFNYPLHSTLNYPLHSTMQCLDDQVVGVTNDQQVDGEVKMCASETLQASQRHTKHKQPQSKTVNERSNSTSKKQHLCKEHGLHPTMGGPCIFQTDDSFDNKMPHFDHFTETDCDSSYLSEHVDDVSFSGTEDCVVTYDAPTARMKLLRRQTGQTQLKNIRCPIGLSESDLLFETTQKHMSMEATRASLPDLSILSTVVEDSTIVASPKRSRYSSDKHSDSTFSANNTLVNVEPFTGPTADESPESNMTLPVPMNSPMNSPMTDSTSSSRPTTDNYDYAEAVATKTEKFPAPQSSSHSRASFKRHHHKSGTRNYSSSNSGKSMTSRELRSSSQHVLRPHNCCEPTVSPQTLRRHRSQSHHISISEASGASRSVVRHTAGARNLQHHKKKALVKKLKQFNNNFYSAQNLHLQTLGHF